jgi:cell division protease FtsH
MFDELTATLGGRASEDIIFGKVSTGALNDLEKVTKQAYSMVVYFGLNKEIGNVSYYDSTGQQEYAFTKPYSEATSQIIDLEIKKLTEQAYERAKALLLENRAKLEQLADILLKKEVIFREDLEAIFGKRLYDDPHEASLERADKPTETAIETIGGEAEQAAGTDQLKQDEE